MAKRVVRTRNGGTWTESQYWSAIRSALRRKFMYWRPLKEAENKARRAVTGKGSQKWEYKCSRCNKWYKGKEVEVDHIVPCGSLRCYEDIVPFLKRLCCEDVDGYRVLCKQCHQEITNEERRKNELHTTQKLE